MIILENEMKFLKHLLMLALAASFFSTAHADEQDNSRFDEELNERDFDALRDFLRSKRVTDMEENVSTLTISGDVRTEYRHLNETCCNLNQGGCCCNVSEDCRKMRLRGHGVVIRDLPVSRNDFDIEFNLRFDYVCSKTWASAHVRFDNSGGVDDNGHSCSNNKPLVNPTTNCIEKSGQCFGDPHGYHGSGNCSDLCVKKAYFGYEVFSCKDTRFFFELGRRGNLYNVFDSNIQFLSRFDGLLLKYERSWEGITDWYFQTAGFLVDERVNHFGWVAEMGFLNIADSGFDFKYSLIDWKKNGINRCFTENPRGFRFINSQFTLIYNLNPEWIGVPVKAYAAFLVNHAAQKGEIFFNKEDDKKDDKKKGDSFCLKHRKNLGWYAGILFGRVRKEGDWALEIQYQVVQAFAMPDNDMGGIGRGNVLNESITTCSLRGNTNFKGWRVQGLYAFTDNLTLDTQIEWSKEDDADIGGKHTYGKMELEAIYAF
jgi:hypothetical protein